MTSRATPRPMLGLALLFLAGAAAAQDAATETPAADAPGEARWTQGALVNLRKTAAPDAPVVARLAANTPVRLLHDGGEWCEISGHEKQGFVACRLLRAAQGTAAGAGKKATAAVAAAPAMAPAEPPAPAAPAAPAELAAAAEPTATAPAEASAAADAPLQAFWNAPDLDTFLLAGHHLDLTLLDARQRRAEHPGLAPPAGVVSKHKGKAADTAHPPRRPVVAEFERMKQLLANGVSAPRTLWQRPLPWSRMLEIAASADTLAALDKQAYDGAIEYLVTYAQIPLPKVKASYFKSAEELGRPSANARQLSAQFADTPYVARVTGPAHWVQPSHGQPWVYGAWDVGSLDLRLAKPMQEVVIDSDGKLSSQATLAETQVDAAEDAGCGNPLLGKWRYSRADAGGGAPGDSAYPLALLRTPVALDLSQSQVAGRTVELAARTGASRPFVRGTLTRIDLDGDGASDLAVWDGYRALPGQTEPSLAYRMVFANVAGVWYVLDNDKWNACLDLAR